MTENFDTFASSAPGERSELDMGFEPDNDDAPEPRFERGFGDGGPGFAGPGFGGRGCGPGFGRAFADGFGRGFDAGFGPGFGRGFVGGFGAGFGRGFEGGFGGGGDFGGFGRGGFGRGGFGGGFGRGGGPDDEGRGRGRRPFDHGQIRIVILSLIAEKPRHGYDIIKTIEERFGGSYSPSPGVVYPTLTLLEEMGYTTVEENGGKKLYTITPQGEAYLKVHPAPGGPMGPEAPVHRGPSPQLMRALGDLRKAIRSSYHAGPPSEEKLAEMVKALDQVTKTIESL